MPVTPQPVPIRQYTFTAENPAVADYVNHELDTVYAVLQGGLGPNHFATQANLPGSLLANNTVGITQLAVLDKASVFRGSNATIGSGSPTNINWDNDLYDTNTMHDPVGTPAIITVQTAGYYRIETLIRWDTASATGFTEVQMIKNNSATLVFTDAIASTAVNVAQYLTCTVPLFIGDTIQITVTQNSGGSRVVTASDSYFMMTLIP